MKKNNKPILIVDDDPDILDAIQLILDQEGFTTTTSSDGKFINKITKDGIPSLILLDMLLSGQDGREICKKLKDDPRTQDIPVIMISAHPSAGKNAVMAGADDFIAKPFDIEELMGKVRKYI